MVYGSPPGVAPPEAARPPVYTWYLVYVVLMTVLYVATALMGVAYLAGAGFIPMQTEDQAVLAVYGVLMLVLGIVFAIAYGAAPFLPKKPWAWVYHLVLICLGLTSCCCVPASVPLLIFWLKPDVKAMFGRS